MVTRKTGIWYRWDYLVTEFHAGYLERKRLLLGGAMACRLECLIFFDALWYLRQGTPGHVERA